MTSRNPHYKNEEVKEKITERFDSALIDAGKLTQAITKSSKSREILSQCTKTVVALVNPLATTEQTMKAMEAMLTKFHSQIERAENRLEKVVELKLAIEKVADS